MREASHRAPEARALRGLVATVALVAGFAAPALAQRDTAVSVPGLGTLTFPTSSRVPAAQTAFIRGVLLLHVFEYADAADAFRDAEARDPGFALAYWGEAMTATHPVWNQQDVAQARTALARLGATPAARAAKAPTARERAYLGAVEVLYGEGAKARRDTLYSSVMHRLADAYPHDDEAQLFYALSLLGLSQGVRNVPTYVRAAAIAESVFARNPHHPGAAHYWIHGMDDPEHASQALPAARALSGIAPDPGHAQHMTSHIFVALGMWDDVVTANESAMRMVDAMMRSRGQAPRLCGHYSEFLDYGYLQQGRVATAKRLLTGCRDQAAADARFRESLISMWTRFLLDTRDWSGDVARWSVEPGDAPDLRLTYWFTRGFVAVRQRDGAAAREALGALEIAIRDVRASLEAHGARTPDDRESLARGDVLRLELAGLVAGLGENRAAALDTLRQATRVEDGMALAYGPPSVDEPSHELLGEELVAAGKADEARREFETALKRTPGRTSVLLGLAHAAAAAGDSAAASRALGKLATIWHGADTDLPGLTEARSRVPQGMR